MAQAAPRARSQSPGRLPHRSKITPSSVNHLVNNRETATTTQQPSRQKKKPPSTSGTLKLLQALLAIVLICLLGHNMRVIWRGQDLAVDHHAQLFQQQKNEFTGIDSGQEQLLHQGKILRKQHYSEDEENDNPSIPILQNVRILVAVASYNFNQIPHLEEVLDSYHDVACSGAQVDVMVHTTVAYPVVWLDLFETRFTCPSFSVTFNLKPKSLRLHLVDCHRQLFFERLHNYDLFIYTEDDIRVTPTTVATYWKETQRLKRTLGDEVYTNYNVGIVRYEYNFPSNIVINDSTRHATQDVTRVYWEHSSALPKNMANEDLVNVLLPHAARGVDALNNINPQYPYITMTNPHQGMFLATRAHLEAWQTRQNCHFDKASNRPGHGPNQRQPLLGTQRVWMSSYQLYNSKYCNVKQVLPIFTFGALTVHHLPNKNYRRKQGPNSKTKLDFLDVRGNLTQQQLLLGISNNDDGSNQDRLLSAIQMHIAMRVEWPTLGSNNQQRYTGHIRVLDEARSDRTELMEARLHAFEKYVERGGVLSEEDLADHDLITWEERSAKLQIQASRKQREEEDKRKKEEQQI